MRPSCRPLRHLAVLFLASACGGTLLAEEPRMITSIEGITEYRLDNGLQVLLFPDPSKPTVTVNLTVFVGSRHEGYGEGGMAHLLEHMLFKGTPDHPDVPKALQERGARFNGTTWYDRTNYYETLPASDENLEFALRLEADRMTNSLIRGEDLASEMTVVRNEFERGENSPHRVLRQRMTAAAYQFHNYGKPTIGNRSDIERVPIPNLRAFYRKHYLPDNAMVVVAGQFDKDKALEYIQKYFGSLPRSERELMATYTEEPPQDGERTVVLRRVGDVALAAVMYHIPAGSHPDFAAVQVANQVLADEPSGRLYKALVETKKAAAVYGSAYALHDPGILTAMAEVRKENSLAEVRNLMIATVEKLAEGVTEEEVARARDQILKYRELQSADAAQVAISLSDWAAQGDWRLYFLHRDRVEAVTADDVQRVAAQYFQQSNRTVGLYEPTSQPQRVAIPARPNLAEVLADYRGREDVTQGAAFDVSPRSVEAATVRNALAGNFRAALLPKPTRASAVHLQLTLRYGDEKSLRDFQQAAALLPELMTRGAGGLTHQEIQDALDRARATLSTTGRPGVAEFNIRTRRSSLPEVLDLLRKVLREPALDEEQFELLRRRQLAQLEQKQNDPAEAGSRLLRRVLSPYQPLDVRYTLTCEEEIERYRALKLDQVRTLHREFLSGEVGEAAIVGDFDMEEIRPRLEALVRGWSAKRPYQRIPQIAFLDVPGGEQVVITPDKASAFYLAGLTLPMSDLHPDHPALVLGNFILGAGSLSSRLGDRVRQKEGLSYGVFSHFISDSLDERSRLVVMASTNPENAARLAVVAREEVERLLKEGVDAEELARAKEGYLQRQTVRWTSDSALASALAETLYTGRTMEYHAELEEKIKALTPDQVNAALRKHIDPKRLVVVTAGDLKK